MDVVLYRHHTINIFNEYNFKKSLTRICVSNCIAKISAKTQMNLMKKKNSEIISFVTYRYIYYTTSIQYLRPYQRYITCYNIIKLY